MQSESHEWGVWERLDWRAPPLTPLVGEHLHPLDPVSLAPSLAPKSPAGLRRSQTDPNRRSSVDSRLATHQKEPV